MEDGVDCGRVARVTCIACISIIVCISCLRGLPNLGAVADTLSLLVSVPVLNTSLPVLNIRFSTQEVLQQTKTEKSILAAVFHERESGRALVKELGRRGFSIIFVSEAESNRFPKFSVWDSKGNNTPADVKDIIFDRCPYCEVFYIDSMSLRSALVRQVVRTLPRRQKVVLGSTSKTPLCVWGRFARWIGAADVQKADAVIVQTMGHVNACPELRSKFIVMPPFYITCSDGSEYYQTRADMERRHEQQRSQARDVANQQDFIFGAGYANRDWATLIKATKGQIMIKIYCGGLPVAGCSKRTRCQSMPKVSREKFVAELKKSLFAAIPIGGDKAGAGITGMLDAMTAGKVAAWTNISNAGAYMIKDGYNGFLTQRYNVGQWSNVITMLLKNRSLVRAMEENMINVAKKTISIDALADELQCHMEALRKLRVPLQGRCTGDATA